MDQLFIVWCVFFLLFMWVTMCSTKEGILVIKNDIFLTLILMNWITCKYKGGRIAMLAISSNETKSWNRIVYKNHAHRVLCFIGDVIGCALDLTVPIITFMFNGQKVPGSFGNFNLDGMFFPVISCSSKLRYDQSTFLIIYLI